MNRRLSAFFSFTALSALLGACMQAPMGLQEPQGRLVYGVTTDNRLVRFGSSNPDRSLTAVGAISGLAAGEQIVGIDFEPGATANATLTPPRVARTGGALTAVSSANRVYTLNPATGAATAVGTAPFASTLTGANFGVDFNPVPNRVRVHSESGQNLRLNQETGATAATDTPLTYAAGDAGGSATPALTGTAYTSSVAGDGTGTTTLYGIDFNRDTLVRLASPNNGVTTTVGTLGVNTTADVGFDIAPDNSLALVSLTPVGANSSTLYAFAISGNDITNASVISRGAPLGVILRGIAIAP